MSSGKLRPKEHLKGHANRVCVWEAAYAAEFVRLYAQPGARQDTNEKLIAEVATLVAEAAVKALDDVCYEARKKAREEAGIRGVVESE